MDTALSLALLLSLLVVIAAVTTAVVLGLVVLRQRRALREARARLASGERDVVVETDPVTGLLTGAEFTARVLTTQREADRGGHPVALLHLGLDGFRAFNSTHGRAAGDAVLAEVAHRLRGAVRGGDEIGRLGGDEFAVLLADPSAAVDVAVRLLAVLGASHDVGTGRVSLGVSIGVAHRPGGQRGEELLGAAEQAVAEAKAAGGGCVRVWDPTTALARGAEIEAAAALRRVVAAGPAGDPADGRLEVHYQPVVDVESCVVSGVEALVRWRRGERLVPPDEFIALAERHGIIADLGRAVLDRCVRDAPRLCEAAGRDLIVAVNVSAPQLADPLLPGAVATAVTALGRRKLVLEMTESVLVAEDTCTQDALDALVEAGAYLTVDDFGTGYATLAYLRRRPFTAFKIDRSYVRDIESDPRTRALVEGLVLLAATMGLGLVAEGVETAAQAKLLQEMGAPTHQGFLHARPEPLDQVLLTIRELGARLRGSGESGESRDEQHDVQPVALGGGAQRGGRVGQAHRAHVQD